MKICFLDKTEFQYDFRDINSNFIRGAENILINLSKNISLLNHEVVVFNNCYTEYKSKNFTWLNITRSKLNNFKFDIAISNNDTRLLDNINAKKKYVISHSLQTIEKFIRKKQLSSYLRNKPIYLLLGNYHKKNMSKLFSIYGTQTIDYGIDQIFLETEIDNKIDNNLSMFTSRTDRNLLLLIDTWKNYICPKYRELKLLITPINKDLKKYNIFNRELLKKNEYINQIIQSRVIILPGHKAELYCLAASEAQELCIPIVTMGIGSLSERVDHNNTGLIAKNAGQFGQYIQDIFCDDGLWSFLRQNLLSKRGNKSWLNASKNFLNTINING